MRTSLLMNSGFVIGTGDVSELALGWCTYNGDHMSMYNPNVSIPKTLVKFLVDWAARNEFDGEARRTLLDIVATQISPELLPAGADGQPAQATESVDRPLRAARFLPVPLPALRRAAGEDPLPGRAGPLRRRLQRRRNCALARQSSCAASSPTSSSVPACPTGRRSASISLSPRGDWRMPSDAQAALWLRWAEAECT